MELVTTTRELEEALDYWSYCWDAHFESTHHPSDRLPPTQEPRTNSRLEDESKHRKERTTFTEEQLRSLELEYSLRPYLCRLRRYELAISLNLTERQASSQRYRVVLGKM